MTGTVPVLAGLRSDGSVVPEVALRAARAWRSGGIVGLPTETVYGLAADAQDAGAVARVYRIKGRPVDHPLIVHVSGAAALDGWSGGPDPVARQVAAAFWPGPLTMIVRRSERAGDFVTGGQPTVALRCPDHPVALACLRALAAESADPARGVAAPSANRFGRVSPTSAADVMAEVGNLLDPDRDLVIDGGRSGVGVESTIVDCSGPGLRVLRAGAVSREQILAVVAGQPPAGPEHSSPPGGPGEDLRAPGTLPSHYAPDARVLLIEEPPAGVDPLGWLTSAAAGVPSGAAIGLLGRAVLPTPPGWLRLAAPDDVTQYAWALYSALREGDQRGLAAIVAVLPPAGSSPLAIAVRDRLVRSAAGR